MIKAVIFDVDGTLVDSNELHVAAWRDAFRRFGKDVSRDEIHSQIGKGGDQLMPVFWTRQERDRFGDEIEKLRANIFARDYLPRVKPFAKVRELFLRLKSDGRQIALASSAKEQELREHKKKLKIEDLLEAETSADDAERSKPYPDIFQAALAGLNNVATQEAIVVGDSPYDAQAAQRAGMSAIGLLSGGFSEARLRAASFISIYRDVADLLERYDESPLAMQISDEARQ